MNQLVMFVSPREVVEQSVTPEGWGGTDIYPNQEGWLEWEQKYLDIRNKTCTWCSHPGGRHRHWCGNRMSIHLNDTPLPYSVDDEGDPTLGDGHHRIALAVVEDVEWIPVLPATEEEISLSIESVPTWHKENP
jgi:hypothetical protein